MARAATLVALVLLLASVAPAAAAPEGQVTWAVHVSLAPTWFDPAETPAVITPFMLLYAMHDAVVKPMPDRTLAPSLAESWTVSKDGRVYEFVLRKGVKFHNGEPVTAEDVKFSLERYKGAAAGTLKEKVGEEGFKKAPIGAGPYKFVSFNPGVELVLDANEQYWRKTPSVKRLVLKAVSDASCATRVGLLSGTWKRKR